MVMTELNRESSLKQGRFPHGLSDSSRAKIQSFRQRSLYILKTWNIAIVGREQPYECPYILYRELLTNYGSRFDRNMLRDYRVLRSWMSRS